MRLLNRILKRKKKEQIDLANKLPKQPAISDAAFYESLKDCKNPAFLEMARKGYDFEEVWKLM